MIVVGGMVSKENMEWLQRSVIGETIKLMNLCMVANRIMSEWLYVTNVMEMGAYKVLVALAMKEDREEVITSGMDLLLNYFGEVKPWTKEEWCQKRRTWIEYYGLPLHTWSSENIKKTVEVWGMMVSMD